MPYRYVGLKHKLFNTSLNPWLPDLQDGPTYTFLNLINLAECLTSILKAVLEIQF